MAPVSIVKPAPGVPYFTPAQSPAPGTALNPSKAPKIFQPLKTRGVELHNRFVVSPMCTYSAENGHLSDWHLVHLGKYAVHGASLVIIEATSVEPRGRISPQCSGLWADSQIAPLRRIVDFLHSQGVKVGIQLGHAGRKASTLVPWLGGTAKKTVADESDGGWPNDIVGASAIPWSEGYGTPKELTVEEIQGLVKSFAEASIRAIKAGIDVIELHAAHGYLLSSFISPVSNKRTDQYGGSFENRTRIVREITEAVRAAIPSETPLWLRVNGTDWMEHTDEPSWTVSDTIALAKQLPELGIDVLDISSGGNSPAQKFKPAKNMHLEFTREIVKALKDAGSPLLIATVGGYSDASEAGSVLEDGKILNADTPETLEVTGGDGAGSAGDLLLAARVFLREPEWVLRMAHELGVEVQWPLQYQRSNRPLTGKF